MELLAAAAAAAAAAKALVIIAVDIIQEWLLHQESQSPRCVDSAVVAGFVADVDLSLLSINCWNIGIIILVMPSSMDAFFTAHCLFVWRYLSIPKSINIFTHIMTLTHQLLLHNLSYYCFFLGLFIIENHSHLQPTQYAHYHPSPTSCTPRPIILSL